jgi:hypothetical protein
MRFRDLKIGDHFIWATETLGTADCVSVNVKTSWGDDGGGFAIDLVHHQECVSPFPHPPFRSGSDPQEIKEWIPADTPVIKLNGAF